MKRLLYAIVAAGLTAVTGCRTAKVSPMNFDPSECTILYPNDGWSIADYVRTDGYYTNAADTCQEFSILYFNKYNDVAVGTYKVGETSNLGGSSVFSLGIGVPGLPIPIPLFFPSHSKPNKYASVERGKCINLDYGLSTVKGDTIVCEVYDWSGTNYGQYDFHRYNFKIVNRDTLIALDIPADSLGSHIVHFSKAKTRPAVAESMRRSGWLWGDQEALDKWAKANRWKTKDMWKLDD